MPDYRLFIRKKPQFRYVSQRLKLRLEQDLDINNISGISMYSVYDVISINTELYHEFTSAILIDAVADEKVDHPDLAGRFHLAIEPLPGQFDQRADSALQCLQLIASESVSTKISSAVLYVFEGPLRQDEQEKIKTYLVNPVESREKDLSKLPQSQTAPKPQKVPVIEDFITAKQEDLLQLKSQFGLAMNLDDLAFIQQYFSSEDRNPTETELKLLDTYWSDHCRHTTFLTEIKDVVFPANELGSQMQEVYSAYLSKREHVYGTRQDEKPICLMDMATIAVKDLKQRGLLSDLEVSEEINACSVRINVLKTDGTQEPWLLMFKNETHNHPTEIEPFGGASTCLGGAIRDPLSGRAYVYQAVRVTGCANPFETVEDTLPGKLPQRKITTEAAHGFSSYGNQIGVAGTQISEIYHNGYKAKRMEVGAVVGAVKEEYVRRESPVAGDVVLLVGGRTGRDGVGGATGSSKEHTEESLTTAGAEVQKGNAPEERKIQRLFRNPEALKLIKKCNDFGAGGVSVAVGELADGLQINLDKVPLKYLGLNGTEIALSESQERMAVVVEAGDVRKFKDLADEENLECTPIAEVTDTNRLVMHWRGKIIVDLDRKFLDSNGVRQEASVEVPPLSRLASGHPPLDRGGESPPLSRGEWPKAEGGQSSNTPAQESEAIVSRNKWLTQLSHLNHCSQQGLHEMFDGTVGGTTVFMPFGGKYQLSPQEGSLQKIPVEEGDTTTASAMTWGFDPELSSWSPFHGGAYSVIESLAKIVAMGGDVSKVRLSFQEYFKKLGRDPKNWALPFQAFLGTLYVQDAFNIAAIGGKDSMSGTFNDIHVPPTLISFAVTTIDTEKAVSAEFKQPGSYIYLLQHVPLENGMPDNSTLKENFSQYYNWVKEGKILSGASIKTGGLAQTLSQMAFGNKIGFAVQGEWNWFERDYGAIVFESREQLQHENLAKIGITTEAFSFIIDDEKIDGEKALTVWQGGLEEIFPTSPPVLRTSHPWQGGKGAHFNKEGYSSSHIVEEMSANAHKGGQIRNPNPKVTIAVFPGTNCEYESKLAFERAGAKVEFNVFRNLTKDHIKESITSLAQAIDNSQIFMIPGGFSAGDEPDGSGKFITAVLRNERIKDSIYRLLERDGLILGVCNGFQALVKSGLLPFGKIGEVDEHSPTLTHNEIGRHISQIVKTKVVSNTSPWLAGFEIGEMHDIAISHGEGRFIVSEKLAKELFENGQVATQYVNHAGNPTLERPHNPNGSYFAIEGITDPTGKIFGKMGHGERYGLNCYKNIPGNKYQALFENGVRYFQ